MTTDEQHMHERGIHIESVQHLNGSYHGRYWAYVVVENGGAETIYHGRSSRSSHKSPSGAFLSRSKAWAFAQKLAGGKERKGENKIDLDCPWTDIGGEG